MSEKKTYKVEHGNIENYKKDIEDTILKGSGKCFLYKGDQLMFKNCSDELLQIIEEYLDNNEKLFMQSIKYVKADKLSNNIDLSAIQEISLGKLLNSLNNNDEYFEVLKTENVKLFFKIINTSEKNINDDNVHEIASVLADYISETAHIEIKKQIFSYNLPDDNQEKCFYIIYFPEYCSTLSNMLKCVTNFLRIGANNKYKNYFDLSVYSENSLLRVVNSYDTEEAKSDNVCRIIGEGSFQDTIVQNICNCTKLGHEFKSAKQRLPKRRRKVKSEGSLKLTLNDLANIQSYIKYGENFKNVNHLIKGMIPDQDTISFIIFVSTVTLKNCFFGIRNYIRLLSLILYEFKYILFIFSVKYPSLYLYLVKIGVINVSSRFNYINKLLLLREKYHTDDTREILKCYSLIFEKNPLGAISFLSEKYLFVPWLEPYRNHLNIKGRQNISNFLLHSIYDNKFAIENFDKLNFYEQKLIVALKDDHDLWQKAGKNFQESVYNINLYCFCKSYKCIEPHDIFKSLILSALLYLNFCLLNNIKKFKSLLYVDVLHETDQDIISNTDYGGMNTEHLSILKTIIGSDSPININLSMLYNPYFSALAIDTSRDLFGNELFDLFNFKDDKIVPLKRVVKHDTSPEESIKDQVPCTRRTKNVDVRFISIHLLSTSVLRRVSDERIGESFKSKSYFSLSERFLLGYKISDSIKVVLMDKQTEKSAQAVVKHHTKLTEKDVIIFITHQSKFISSPELHRFTILIINKTIHVLCTYNVDSFCEMVVPMSNLPDFDEYCFPISGFVSCFDLEIRCINVKTREIVNYVCKIVLPIAHEHRIKYTIEEDTDEYSYSDDA